MGMILGIIHYVGGFFFVILLGGLFFSLVSVGMMVVMMIMMMNGKHIWPHEMVFFSFSSYINLVQRTDFFSFSPTQEVIRVKIATLCWLCCCCCRR